MCCHTPADNHVASFLQDRFDSNKPEVLSDVIKGLKSIPEYDLSATDNVPPTIVSGKPDNTAGKIFVDMTGGTGGAKDIFARLASAGVSTIICMHVDEDRIKRARKEHLNIVIAGHIASDNLGLNLLLDKMQKRAPIEVIECSGFRRVKRKK